MIVVRFESSRRELCHAHKTTMYSCSDFNCYYELSKKIALILVAYLVIYPFISIPNAYAELNDLPTAIQCVWNHVIEHSKINDSDLQSFFIEGEDSVYSGAAKLDNRYVKEEAYNVKLYFNKSLSCIHYNVWISHDGELLNCNCDQFICPNLDADKSEWSLISEIQAMRNEWEDKYGPCELWKVQQNADFYNATNGHSPYQTTTGTASVIPKSLPSNNQLTQEEAYELVYYNLIENLAPPESDIKIYNGMEDILMHTTVNEYVNLLEYGVYFSGEHWFFFQFYELLHSYKLYPIGEAIVDANTGEVLIRWKNYDFQYRKEKTDGRKSHQHSSGGVAARRLGRAVYLPVLQNAQGKC